YHGMKAFVDAANQSQRADPVPNRKDLEGYQSARWNEAVPADLRYDPATNQHGARGIQGRLNKQFAITIAISVMISAFNALTLSPGLAAMLLRPRKRTRGPLGRFFGLFNRWFDKATHGYIRVSHGLIRKSAIGIAI